MEYAKGIKFAADFAARTKYNLEQIKDTPYDVTQLINSLVGLLIIPRQYGYAYLSDEMISPDIRSKVCSKVIINSYPDGTNVKEILRHMKNAVSHSRMKFHVDKPGEDALVQDIELVEFRDRQKNKNGEVFEFCMIISVDLLHQFLYEFSDVISKRILSTTK